jgi:NB-ARC domain
MDAGRPRFEADRREREDLTARFFDALRDGDIDGLRELLAADVEMVADGGGKAPALARSVFGADNVARVLVFVFPLLAKIDAGVEPRALNGQPGAIVRDRDGKVVGTLTLDALGGRIQTIRSVANEALRGRRMLLVLDNVWNQSDLEPFLAGGRHCVRLVTSRRVDVAPVDSAIIHVDRMTPQDGHRIAFEGPPYSGTARGVPAVRAQSPLAGCAGPAQWDPS